MYGILGMVALLAGCRLPQISRHFEHNRYLPLYDNVVYNDSVSLFFPSFGDVVYERDARRLRRLLRNVPLAPGDSLVLGGNTAAPPYYSFALMVNEACNGEMPSMDPAFFYRDTCVSGRWFKFIGYADGDNDRISVNKDLTDIWGRMGLDSLTGDRFGSPFTITGTPTNKLYAVLDNLRQFPAYTEQEQWNKTQLVLTYASFLGDHEAYRRELAALEARMEVDSAALHTLETVPKIRGDDALACIVAESRNRKLVMINENHFYPTHRLLVYDLLDSLRAAGFQYLALEALDPRQEETVNRTRKIDLHTGFYTQEQQYARMVRKALELGFTLIGYENTDPAIDREVGQATNLYEKTFAKDPHAKVLVYAGMAHIFELPDSDGRKWMAAHFRERYGIDPLTIDQNGFKSLHSLAEDTYQLVRSDRFDSHQLRSVDYHVINGRSVAATVGQEYLVYKNPRRDSVQVLLFLTDKPANIAVPMEVPYFTTIVPGRSKTRIPKVPGKPVLMVAYDRQGNRVN